MLASIINIGSFCLRITFHEYVSSTVSSSFTVTFVVTRFLAFAKLVRKFPTTITTITCFMMFLGVPGPRFIKPFVYCDRR